MSDSRSFVDDEWARVTRLCTCPFSSHYWGKARSKMGRGVTDLMFVVVHGFWDSNAQPSPIITNLQTRSNLVAPDEEAKQKSKPAGRKTAQTTGASTHHPQPRLTNSIARLNPSTVPPPPPSLPINLFPFSVALAVALAVALGLGLTWTNPPRHFPQRCLSTSIDLECRPYSAPHPSSPPDPMTPPPAGKFKNALAAAVSPVRGAPTQIHRYL